MSSETSFGQNLWDNLPAVEIYTQEGIDFLGMVNEYVKKGPQLKPITQNHFKNYPNHQLIFRKGFPKKSMKQEFIKRGTP